MGLVMEIRRFLIGSVLNSLLSPVQGLLALSLGLLLVLLLLSDLSLPLLKAVVHSFPHVTSQLSE
jgi:hypothetical protein